jgi:hypothetical protein
MYFVHSLIYSLLSGYLADRLSVLSRPYCSFLFTFSSPSLPSSPLDKGLLHLANLSLELLDLLPAVQRPAVVLPQAVPDILARLLDFGRGLLQLLARLELGLQVHDLLLHAVVAASGIGFGCCGGGPTGAVILVEGRAEVGGESVRVAGGLLFGDGVGLDVGGQGRSEVGELLGAGVADARELGVDAGLDFEFKVFCAGAVGLGQEVVSGCCVLQCARVGGTSGFDWRLEIRLSEKRTGLSLWRVSDGQWLWVFPLVCLRVEDMLRRL